MDYTQTKSDIMQIDANIKAHTRYTCGLEGEWKDEESRSRSFFSSPDDQRTELFYALMKMGYIEKFYNAPYYWKVAKNGVEVLYIEGDLYLTASK